MKDKHRYVFWLNEKTYQEVKDNPIIQKRVEAVKANRLASSASSTQAAAKTPYAFVQKVDTNETPLLKLLVKMSSCKSLFRVFHPKIVNMFQWDLLVKRL